LRFVAAFVAGRVWPRVPAPAPAAPQIAGVSAADVSQRILLTSIAVPLRADTNPEATACPYPTAHDAQACATPPAVA